MAAKIAWGMYGSVRVSAAAGGGGGGGGGTLPTPCLPRVLFCGCGRAQMRRRAVYAPSKRIAKEGRKAARALRGAQHTPQRSGGGRGGVSTTPRSHDENYKATQKGARPW